MTKTNQLLTNYLEKNNQTLKKTYARPQNRSRRWKNAKPDLLVNCFICDVKFAVKYILPRKTYSKKNLWGHWTKKPADQNKYICNACIVKILYTRRFNDWAVTELANDFHTYLSRGSFNEK